MHTAINRPARNQESLWPYHEHFLEMSHVLRVVID